MTKRTKILILGIALLAVLILVSVSSIPWTVPASGR